MREGMSIAKSDTAEGPAGDILFRRPRAEISACSHVLPPSFDDLNLDQWVAAVAADRAEYDLAPFFAAGLTTTEDIRDRQLVFGDLDGVLGGHVAAFAHRMRAVRRGLTYAGNVRSREVGQRVFLDAAEHYGQAVDELAVRFAEADLVSIGLQRFRDHLIGYQRSERFVALHTEGSAVCDELSRVRYLATMKGSRIVVQRFHGEADFASQIEETFARFRHDAAQDYSAGFPDTSDVGHVEAAVLDRVARLFPDAFAALAGFCDRHSAFVDEGLARFERQAQFCLAYLDYIGPLRSAGLPFCYPVVTDAPGRFEADDMFDIVLATTLTRYGSVVQNGVRLQDPERIMVVTGPNQGGKTTFARTVGQLHELARLGLPVPGTRVVLSVCDQVYTHFERGEDMIDLRGKLLDDLVRIKEIIDRATSRSVVILNEIFTSTTALDAATLSTRILERLSQIGSLCVCVTFLDELARVDARTVSLVAGVAADDPTRRTFRMERRPADGRAFAAALAAKHGLTYRRLAEVLTP